MEGTLKIVRTRWFKYDRDLCGLFTHKSVPVILEPPCNFVVKLLGIRQVGRAVSWWYNIQMDTRGYVTRNETKELTEGRIQWRTLVLAVLKMWLITNM
jgi:hypothetical protein